MRIRDPIHGDIELSRLEEKIIRTKEMQRLHWVRQLGSTYQVYPCALHTRFDHSLGVSYIAKQILDSIEKKGSFSLDADEKEFISNMALVHDIVHVSFGHMLESELCLISDHDTGDRLKNCLTQGKISEVLGSQTLEIIPILTASDPSQLEKPYQLEIIKDTISADLLDYLRRDTYFTGIKRSYDPRIIDYFNIAEYDGKPHLVIDITEDGARCEDMLVEMEHLLRFRYTMGERVYNYHTKIAADSMIGKALNEANVTEDFLMNVGDEGVISHLMNGPHGVPLARELGNAFWERRILRRAYMLDRTSFGGKITNFVNQYYGGHQQRTNCKDVELKLIEICRSKGISIEEKDLIIFCHEPEMNLKAANALVREEGKEPERLFIYLTAAEGIMHDHERLWRFYVYSRRDIVDKVGEVCSEYFNKKNLCQPIPAETS